MACFFNEGQLSSLCLGFPTPINLRLGICLPPWNAPTDTRNPLQFVFKMVNPFLYFNYNNINLPFLCSGKKSNIWSKSFLKNLQWLFVSLCLIPCKVFIALSDLMKSPSRHLLMLFMARSVNISKSKSRGIKGTKNS